MARSGAQWNDEGRRDSFAMTPESLITGLLPDEDTTARAVAFLVYAYSTFARAKTGGLPGLSERRQGPGPES
jgi:hypothetical protein